MNASPFQAGFGAALLDADLPPPDGLRVPAGDSPARRFAVYRNNVLVSLVDALAARFPVTERLVGTDFFRAMAQAFAAAAPPRSPLLTVYGDAFADFIAAFPPAAGAPYLADVARLEAVCTRAYHAADVAPLPEAAMRALAARDGEKLLATRLTLHPSVEVLHSPFAVATIWAAHQGDDVPCGLDPEGPEDVLVARPESDVEVTRLPPGGAIFVGALGDGVTLAEAAQTACVAEPGFDPTENLVALIGARVIIAVSDG
ncbi:MAG: DUF2063 domain-containing protein [Alphaproteobacteria bacterium]|nr:DUF2063 domain-containing protein [Alphaproteobacteria bacterium]